MATPAGGKQNTAVERAPIITVMGHVDHGKSTLLDYIRKTNVVEKEAGGITQHLSAYEVEHAPKEGTPKKITFLDTPGHAAFSEMRSRGARVADIAILVVSAEDGVQAQTKEALKQITDAGIPYIVAITKIDKPNADIERTKQSLVENEIYLEGYGGNISYVPVSAKNGEGVDDLMDMLLLAAELEELTGNPAAPAQGIVIESRVDARKGTSATLIIKNGTLRKGQFIVAEDSFSPVRALENFLGEQINEASLSCPVRVTGFDKAPAVGAIFAAVATKKEAEKLTAEFVREGRPPGAPEKKANEEVITVPVVIKADTLGTLEAIEGEIARMELDHVHVKILHAGIGTITEGDVQAAAGAESPILIGFGVKPDKNATQTAERFGATIEIFDVIYRITEWLSEESAKRIPKELKQETRGHAEILRIFSTEKHKQVIGGRVTDGEIEQKAHFKILRRGNEIGHGEIIELQHQKARVGRVEEGKEFGAMVEAKMELAKGDTIEAFVIHE